MKRILHITPSFYPARGGVETHVLQVCRELVQEGYQVEVLTEQFGDQSAQEVIDGIHIQRFSIDRQYRSAADKINHKLLIWQQMLTYHDIFQKADIVHVHDVMWWMLPVWPLIWLKVYMTFHGWEGKYPVPWKNKLARKIWSILALKTIHVGSWIQEFYWDAPTTVLYGGVTDQFLQLKSQSKKSQSDMFHISFIGRLEAENEIEKYLQLIDYLQQKISIQVTWVGDGAYREKCQQVGTVTGMVDDVLKYIDAADLVCANSYLSIMEAQARGKIVIGIYDNLLKKRYLQTYPGHKMMLVSDDVAQLATQVEELCTHPSIMQLYQTQAQQWARLQTWQEVTAHYEQLWGMI